MEISVPLAVSTLALLLIWMQLVRFCREYWWTPRAVTRLMAKQGLKGPRPRFISGNTSEIASICKGVFSRDMESLNHDVVHRFLPHLSHWLKVYGNTFIFWWGLEPAIFVTNAELAKEAFTSNEGHGDYAKMPSKHRIRNALYGGGLFAVTGKAWEHQRSVVAPAFHYQKLKGLVADMVRCSAQMVEEWEELINGAGKAVAIDVSEEFKKVTANIIASTSFGSNYEKGKLAFQQIGLLQKLLAESDYYSFPGKRFLPSPLNRKIWRVSREMNHSMYQIVQDRRNSALFGKLHNYGNDLLGLMLAESEKPSGTGHKFTSQNVVDECKTFYFAGHETTALLLTWTVMLLSIHPEWQDRAREEVLQILEGGSPLTVEMLNKMKILGMVLNESLRLYPPVPVTVRQALRDTKLGDLFIPKGMALWIAVVALHHDPELWGADSNEFKPERFAGGVANAAKNPSCFTPFGQGPRSCLGSTFAIMEAKAVLAAVLSRFTCRLSPTYRHAPVSVLTSKPSHGMPIILERLREAQSQI